jgi:myo-inositol-1(or 4)-monophosphatase
MRYYATGIDFETKGTLDLVTIADRESEAAVLEIIRHAHPEHGILGEEGGQYTGRHGNVALDGTRGPLWIVDPLDGTTNFAHSFPAFSVSIALYDSGEGVLGGVYDPVAREMFIAERHQGATLNGRPIKPSRHPELTNALLASGFGYDRHLRPEWYLKFWEAFFREKTGIRRMGSAALDLCMVACGRVDGYWEAGLKPWDSAAGALILKEAGGRLSTYDDQPYSPFGPSTVASNGLLHGEMLRVIQGCLAKP